jgi:hypothetical protein
MTVTTGGRATRRSSDDVGIEVDVEPGEQLAVLVLGADDLHLEAEVLTEQQQRLV